MRLYKRLGGITMGVELETYSIEVPDNRICRDLHFPKRSIIEKGERFTRDWSIGSEYNSKVFRNVREALFLLKTGLRKYTEFRQNKGTDKHYVIFPTGGWIDRFAGSHLHIALPKHTLTYPEAKELAAYLHDHIPFLIVLMANSPVWHEKITPFASNRLLLGSKKYCRVTKSTMLYKHRFRELTYNRGGAKKPPTLELRVGDGSVPEYLTAALCVVHAIALSWLKKKKALNHSTYFNYLMARQSAVRDGVRAKLVWNNHWVSVPHYVDLFFRKYEEELDEMDVPDDIIRIFKFLKKGWNQARVIREAAQKLRKKSRSAWQRQFAKRYAIAIEELLDGNSFKHFVWRLGIKLPDTERTWLGRKEANW